MKKEIPFQVIKGQLWVHFQGRNFIYESQAKKKLKKTSTTEGKAGQLVAPMPGKVTRILKNVGDLVNAGESVLVLEAMKMEYTLKANMDGAMATLHCKLGEQVPLGKVLVVIK